MLVLSDASELSRAACAYLRLTSVSGEQRLGFVIGKTKLAPKHGHTVPRLELCAVVLATEMYDAIAMEFDTSFDAVYFFADSKMVIDYIRKDICGKSCGQDPQMQ